MDFRNIKKLTIGGVALKQLFINGIQVWKSFTNQVPISTDTDGSIFNGVGYKENVRLGSSGGISSSAQNGSVTTGFIPFPDGDKTIIRMKGVEWIKATANHSGHYYINFYDGNKKALTDSASNLTSALVGNLSHIITATRDSNGVETISFNKDYGTGNTLIQFIRAASFIRINAYGKGADMIVTINEEIT